MGSNNGKVFVGSFIPKGCKTRLKVIAKAERTSVSRLILLAIERYLQQLEAETGR